MTAHSEADSTRRDQALMRAALRQAERGLGRTSPNPMVGVILVQGEQIVATGYHQRAGLPHAEQVALAQAGSAAQGAEAFVNLEPCCHRGRTGPCTEALIRAGVRRVVAGIIDPNPVVSGRGIEALRSSGIEVACGLLEDDCRRLNAPFFKYIQTGLPFVTAKFAMTLDGKIATATGDSRWISSTRSRQRAHELRNVNDAVLVGWNTVRRDNPLLTVREVAGGRDPVRVVLDPRGEIAADAAVLTASSAAPTWIATSTDGAVQLRGLTNAPHDVLVLPTDEQGRLSMAALLVELGRREIMTLLVEGGGETLGSAFAAGAVDRVVAFVAPKLVGGRLAPSPWGGSGIPRMGEALQLTRVVNERLEDDIVISGDTPNGWGSGQRPSSTVA